MAELYTSADVESSRQGWTYTASEVEQGDADSVLHDYWKDIRELMNADAYKKVREHVEHKTGYSDLPEYKQRRIIMAAYLRNAKESIWL